MTRPKELIRDFRKPDNIMMEQGQGFHDLLVEHLPDFTAKFPHIDSAFVLAFQGAIDDANETDRDRAVVEDISVEAALMNGFVADGKVAFMNGIFCAKKAFPNNPTMVNKFGLPEYEEYSNSHTKFPLILDQMHDLASDPLIKPLLLAQGMTAADITNIDTISTSIKEKNKTLFKEKKNRPPTTQDRISKLNIVWAMMVTISERAKIIYFDNYALYHMFLLYPGDEGTTPTPVPPVPPVV